MSASSESSSPVLSASTPPSSVPPSPTFSALEIRDVSDDDKAAAAKLKADANEAFKKHDFANAAHVYSQAIELNPMDPTLYCNRAYARMKLEEHGYAIDDCNNAVKLDPKYVKAFYRRALCQLSILKPHLAVADFKKVLALEPQNTLARSQMETTQKLIRKVEFEKAIEMEEEIDAVQRCQQIVLEGGCDMDESFKGPRLPTTEDGQYSVSLEFVQKMMDWFKEGKSLPRRYIWEIVIHAYNIFAKEDSLVETVLEKGMTLDVIGDVHGQYFDLLHLYSLTGFPTNSHCLLMNGDLVDRGSWSIEVIVTAFAFKWLYPTRMFINRGNHEAKEMNRTYGFEGEAKHKHGEQTYKLFAHVFTALPLATLVNTTQTPTKTIKGSSAPAILSPEGHKRYFVVHGGLFSKDGVKLDDIRQIPRLGRQPGQDGLMCELLWTDPQEKPGRGPSKRGVGIAFGPDVTKRWCELNQITGIFRSHEVRQDGYAIEHNGLCTTVFSAPNYVDQAGNKGAFVRIDAAGNCEYIQFDAKPHPPMKPMAYVQGGLASMMMA